MPTKDHGLAKTVYHFGELDIVAAAGTSVGVLNTRLLYQLQILDRQVMDAPF